MLGVGGDQLLRVCNQNVLFVALFGADGVVEGA